jgi:hypothetical protein
MKYPFLFYCVLELDKKHLVLLQTAYKALFRDYDNVRSIVSAKDKIFLEIRPNTLSALLI